VLPIKTRDSRIHFQFPRQLDRCTTTATSIAAPGTIHERSDSNSLKVRRAVPVRSFFYERTRLKPGKAKGRKKKEGHEKRQVKKLCVPTYLPTRARVKILVHS